MRTLPPLTPDAVRALVAPDLWTRGEAVWREGAVLAAVREGATLRGQVRGSNPTPYATRAAFGPAGLRETSCECPHFTTLSRRPPRRRQGPPLCKHLVATLLLWAHEPARVVPAPAAEERLAGAEREALLGEVRAMLRQAPEVAEVLALPLPGRKRHPPFNPKGVDKQVNFLLSRHRRDPAKLHDRLDAIREEGLARLQGGQAADAARLLTHLLARLLALYDKEPAEQPRDLRGLVLATLAALELAALEAEWPDDERQGWLRQLMGWWAEPRYELGDPLMDLVLQSYRPADEALVEGWLRGLLRTPKQAGVVSERWQRDRILAFLLALYAATGRDDAFLDLCWEEDEDARAALRLAELGRLGELRTLAAQGLGGAGPYQAVAAALWAREHRAEALALAEGGRRYADPWRPGLLDWIARHALLLGEPPRALHAARAAWDEAPSPERYATLRASAEAAGVPWPPLREALLGALARPQQTPLAVAIALAEGDPRRAAALLPEVSPDATRIAQGEAIVAALLDAGAQAEAIPVCFDSAETLVGGRSRPHYARAAALLAATRQRLDTPACAAFDERLRAFLQAHRRQPALLEEVASALASE